MIHRHTVNVNLVKTKVTFPVHVTKALEVQLHLFLALTPLSSLLGRLLGNIKHEAGRSTEKAQTSDPQAHTLVAIPTELPRLLLFNKISV